MVSISEDWNINYITKQIYHDQWKDELTGSSSSIAEVSSVVCRADSAGDLNNKYFILYSAKDETKYHVWYNVNSAGTDPAPVGSTAIEVAVATGATNTTVATATRAAITAANSTLDFTTGGASATVTITNKNAGSATDVADFNVGGASTYSTTTQGVGETVLTVNALYSWLQDTFDELGQMDDQVPMSAQTPTEYTLINEWFIDEVSIKYLKGGAIQTSGWTRVVGTGTNIGVIQVPYNTTPSVAPDENDLGQTATLATDGDTGTILFADTTRRKLWIRPTTSAAANSFDNTLGTLAITATSGMSVVLSAAASTTGENIWANMYTIGTIEANTAIYVIQDSTKLSAWWPVGHIDVLVRVQEFNSTTGDNSGSLSTIMIGARQYSKLFDHFVSTGITGGRNPVPLATGADLNNTTGQYSIQLSGSAGTFAVGERFEVAATPAKQGTITAVSGTNPTVVLSYYLSGTDRTQFATTDVIAEIGSGNGAGTVNGAPTPLVADYGTTTPITMTFGDTTQNLNNGSGSVAYDVIINCNGRTVAQMYEWVKFVTMRGYTNSPTQLKTGTGTTADTNIDGEQYIYLLSSFTPVKASPFGTFAGGKFFGAQGVWITNYATADAQNFQLIDATGTSQVPPNTVSVTVNSVVADDVVGVFVYDTVGGTIDKDTYTFGADNVVGAGTIGVSSTINAETPQSGVLRTIDNDTAAKTEYQYEYSSWSYTVFTLNTLYSNASPGTMSSGTATYIFDSGGSNFFTDRTRIGDKVTNKTDSSWALVTAVSTDNLTTTPLTEGTGNIWSEGIEYYVETVTSVYHTANDNVYVPILNEVVRSGSTSVVNTLIKGTGNPIPVIVRVRQGKVILPFEITNTITAAAGMTQAAIRTTDSIAT